MSQLYIHENGKNPTTGSQDIVQTRMCHININVMPTPKTICPPPLRWGTEFFPFIVEPFQKGTGWQDSE